MNSWNFDARNKWSADAVADPEVVALTQRVRSTISEAYRLSLDIQQTLEELQEFRDDLVERRKGGDGYAGVDRRAK